MALRLLHYSDVENAYDHPERIGRLAGLLQALDGEDALAFGTGDNTSPGVLALVSRGEQSLDFFDAVDPDADTFGNHDFDFGPERTLELVAASPQRWICANVRVRDEGDTARARGTTGAPFGASVGVRPTAVFEAVDDTAGSGGTGSTARIGVTGVTTPLTASINPNAGELAFTDPVPAAREAVADLRERGVDHVVVLSHLGRGDEELAAELDVDVVLGGHLHSELVERVDGTLLTRPGVNGEVLLEVTLPGREVRRHEVREGPLDESVAAAMRDRMDAAGVDEVVAHVEEPIERTERTCFRGESRIGNFVADAYRWAGDADVALQNSGGIRSGPPLAGDVTLGDLVSVIPFDEPAVVAEVSGERLRETFEQAGGAGLGFGEPEWWHAHVAGARLTYDYRTHELVEAEVGVPPAERRGEAGTSSPAAGGEPIDPDRTYRLATADYLLTTTDEFPALTPDCRVETLDTQYRVLEAYAREHGIDPRLEGRIVRVGLDGD